MRTLILGLIIALIGGSGAFAGNLADCAGVIRVYGDASIWMSCCFVIGDGSWIITTSDAVTEKAGPQTSRTICSPLFISAYTGKACECELKANDKDLNVALLKLPVSGLPAAPLAQMSDFSKAAYGTMGELMGGDQVGNRWATEIYGITREKSGNSQKLVVGEWEASKAFVTDISKYKWLFVSDVSPEKSVPNGSMVTRGSSVVGMYLNKLTITGGKNPVTYGRCAMSTEIAQYLSKNGMDSSTLHDPPTPTVKRDPNADKAFQLQAQVYSMIGAGKPNVAVGSATELVKLLPGDAMAQMALGIALTGTGKFEDALKVFDEAIKLDPKLVTLRTNRALTLIGLKKKSEAEAELVKAVEEAPADVRPVTALADFYLGDEKTFDKALTHAKKATTMVPNSPAALLLLARVQKRMKDYQAAVNTIGEALKMAPDWGDAWFALGATYEESGDKTNAERAYRKLVEKQPKNPSSILTLALFLADQGKKDEAKELIARVRALNPPKLIMDAAQALEDKIEEKKPEKAGT